MDAYSSQPSTSNTTYSSSHEDWLEYGLGGDYSIKLEQSQGCSIVHATVTRARYSQYELKMPQGMLHVLDWGLFVTLAGILSLSESIFVMDSA
jgi:hypothetical protein